MTYREDVAGFFAFFQGFFIDIYSGGVYGLFSFLYVGVCISISFLSNFIDIHKRPLNMIVILLAMTIKDLLFVLITCMLLNSIPINLSLVRSLALCMMLTVFSAPVIFNLLNRLRYDGTA